MNNNNQNYPQNFGQQGNCNPNFQMQMGNNNFNNQMNNNNPNNNGNMPNNNNKGNNMQNRQGMPYNQGNDPQQMYNNRNNFQPQGNNLGNMGNHMGMNNQQQQQHQLQQQGKGGQNFNQQNMNINNQMDNNIYNNNVNMNNINNQNGNNGLMYPPQNNQQNQQGMMMNNNNPQGGTMAPFQRKIHKPKISDKTIRTHVISKCSSIDQNELNEIKSIVTLAYSRCELPLSDKICNEIKKKLTGTWFVFVSDCINEPPKFSLSCVSDSEILKIKLEDTMIQICRIQ